MLHTLGATEYMTGSRGDVVREIQDLLTRRGYSPGPVDGMFGAQTKTAVMRFQSDRGFTIDGIVGPVTWAALHGTIPQGPTAPAPAPVPVPQRTVSTVIVTPPVAGRPGGVNIFESLSPTMLVIGGLGVLTMVSVFTGKGGRPKKRRRR